MFCKYCGQEITPNTKFCGNCGSPVDETPSQNTDAPAQYEATPETPVSDTYVDNNSFAQADFDIVTAPAKKKFKFKPLLISGIALVLVTAIVLTIVIFKKNKNDTVTSIESSVGTIVTALSQNTSIDKKVTTVVDGLLDIADNVKTGTDVEFKINLSDETAELLNSVVAEETGENVDFGALNETSVKISYHAKDNFMLFEAALNSGGQDLIDARVIVDTKEYVVYIGSPSLSSTYLSISIEDLLEEMGLDSSSAELVKVYLPILLKNLDTSILPSRGEIEELVDTYSKAIISCLDTDREGSTTITVSGISQNVTESVIEVTEGDIQKITLNLLKTFQNDDNAKGILEKSLSLLSKLGIDELGNVSMTNIEFGLAAIISSMESSADFSSEVVVMTLTRYVDSNNMIVGRNLVVEDETILYHATATNGNKYATIFEVQDSVTIEGQGTVTNGKKTGTYIVNDGIDTITFNLKDFSIDSNGINGSFIYYIDDEMMDEVFDGNSSVISSLTKGAKPGFEFKFSNSESSSGFEYNLIAGEKVLFGISINAKSTARTNISAPQNSMSIREADRWLETIDEDAFMERIEKSPLGFLVSMING